MNSVLRVERFANLPGVAELERIRKKEVRLKANHQTNHILAEPRPSWQNQMPPGSNSALQEMIRRNG